MKAEKQINILLIEDNPSDARLISELLKEVTLLNYQLHICGALEEGIKQLQSQTTDIILLDLNLPDSTGQRTFEKLHTRFPTVPIVLTSGMQDEELSLKLIELGAQDYINKSNITSPRIIEKSILHSLERNKLLMALQKSEEFTKRILVSNNDCIKVLDLKGNLLSMNEIGQKMLEIDNVELYLNRSWLNLWGDDKSIVLEALNKAKKGKVGRFSGFRPTVKGAPKWWEIIVSPIKNAQGEVYRLLAVSRDITSQKQLEKEKEILTYNLNERVKELSCLYSISSIIEIYNISLDEMCKEIVRIIPSGWQYPDITCARIVRRKNEYKTTNYKETKWKLSSDIKVDGSISGFIEVFYLKEISDVDEGPFLKEEKNLLNIIAARLGHIIERKQADEKIIDGHKMLRTLIDNLPAMIYIKDAECRKVIANIADVNNIGYQNEEEILGKTDVELFPGIIGQRGYEDDQMVISSGKAIIDRIEDFINSEGKRRWISTSKIPLKNNEGEITGLVGIGHDITERRKLVTNLSTATEIAKLGYWEFDVISGNFIFDDQYYRIIHGSSTEKQGGNIMSAEEFAKRFVHPDDSKQVGVGLQEAISSTDPEYLGKTEARVFRDNGDITNVLIQFKLEKDDSGRTIKVVGINQDITQQKHFEQELIRAKEKAEESDRLKSAFLANMSHEIRTPMNGILGFANLLRKPNLKGEEQNKYIEVISKSGDRLLKTINNLLDISKIESGEVIIALKECNVKTHLGNLYSFFKTEVEKKGMKLIFKNRLSAEKIMVKTDPNKFDSILTNLIKNAIKYSHSGSIEFGYHLKDEKEPAEIEFYVTDTGIGISKNRLIDIFDRFVQADIEDRAVYQGNGLGLAITKSYVEMLGGKIWVESEEGKGSTFFFTIPYIHVPENKEQFNNTTEEIKRTSPTTKLKILIAEDDEASAAFMKITTAKWAKEIISVENGIDAIESCLKNPDIDLVFMDIQMPKLNGYKATCKIREFNKKVVIIAQTAFALNGDREEALEAGCNDYISKPVSQKKMNQLIKKHFVNDREIQ